MSYKLEIAKEHIKFSAAHFSVFGSEKAERLHGHNYYIEVKIEGKEVDSMGFLMEINQVKNAAFTLSQQLDEFILIPKQNPYLNIQNTKDQIQVSFANKAYSFPFEDVKVLEMTNITCENLAYWLWQELAPQLPDHLKALEVCVGETRGQRATFSQELP